MLLAAAAKRNDGALAIPTKKSTAEAYKLLQPLVSKKLVEATALTSDGPRWPGIKKDEPPQAFRITAAGLEAIGIQPATAEKDRSAPAGRQQPRKPKKAPSVPAPKVSDVNKRQRAKAVQSKQEIVLDLLRTNDGASIAAITKATGWQAHSIRGFLSGTVKKKLGLKVDSSKAGDERVYRIVEPGKTSIRKAS